MGVFISMVLYQLHSLVSDLRYTITCSMLGMGLGYGVAV